MLYRPHCGPGRHQNSGNAGRRGRSGRSGGGVSSQFSVLSCGASSAGASKLAGRRAAMPSYMMGPRLRNRFVGLGNVDGSLQAVSEPVGQLCCNPFRIPRHVVKNELRIVPQEVRERLAHVSFAGNKICQGCRKRVYDMLRQRNQLKRPSLRLDSAPQIKRSPQQPQGSASSLQLQEQQGALLLEPQPPPPPTPQPPLVHNQPNLRPSGNLSTPVQDTMPRRSRGQQPPAAPPDKLVCCFCGLAEDNEVEFGKFYQHSGIVTHYYCLLLSSNMEQKGKDHEGILGFLPNDIQKEIRRGRRLVCSYCKKNGATLGCCNAKCKRIFHLPCGLKNGSLHQFFDEFRSYCINHKPKQVIDEKVKKEVAKMSEKVLCCICYENVQPSDNSNTLWAPCCKKNAWFHRKCVQHLAVSAGYFFKCPLCNSKEEFHNAMQKYGIYIPKQDASWELVPNAFEELLYRHSRCDSKNCLCPKGRNYNSNHTQWELILCQNCGSQGMHVYCGGLKGEYSLWDCQECLSILKKAPRNAESTDESTSNSSDNLITQRENPAINTILKECEDDTDSDISVGREYVPVAIHSNNLPGTVPPVKLRPGPRSFKLQQVEKLKIAESDQEDSGPSSSSLSISNEEPRNNVTYTKSDILPGMRSKLNQIISTGTGSSMPNGIKISAVLSAALPGKPHDHEVVCLDSDDDGIQFLCHSTMKRSRNNRQIGSVIRTTTGRQSTNSNQPDTGVPLNVSNLGTLPNTDSEMIQEQKIMDNSSPFNLVISNVTSVPEEFFASVPDEPEKPLVLEPPPTLGLATDRKRNRSSIDDYDCLMITNGPKRARLENSENKSQSSNSSVITKADSSDTAADPASMPVIAQTSSNDANSPIILPVTNNNTASSSLESCHGDAGTVLTRDAIRHCIQDSTTVNGAAAATNSTQQPIHLRTAKRRSARRSEGRQATCEFPIRSIDNGSSSCDGNSVQKCGSKSKYSSSSSNRFGLIPQILNIQELKFKVKEDIVQLIYGENMCEVEIKGGKNTATLYTTTGIEPVSSSFTGSNLNSRSLKLKKPHEMSCEDSTKSNNITKIQKFFFENDDAVSGSEFPQINYQNLKKKRINRTDLKENCDPEVSSSSNNTLGDLDGINQTVDNFMEVRDSFIGDSDSINKNDSSPVQFQNEDSDTRSRRRITRYFMSMQNSNIMKNSVIDQDLTVPNADDAFSFEKSNQTAKSDQSVRNLRSLKSKNDDSNLMKKNKHLKNVDINDLTFTLTGRASDIIDDKEIHNGGSLKVSIELQEIKELIKTKPNLFLNKNKDFGKSCVDRVDEKLKVNVVSKKNIFLKKSQSFDSLLNFRNDDSRCSLSRSKSLNDLSNVDEVVLAADMKDYIEKKIRRSQRRKTRQFERYECVR